MSRQGLSPRRLGWPLLALAASAGLGAACALAQDRGGSEPPRGSKAPARLDAPPRGARGSPALPHEITPRLRAAIARGFDYLVRNQQPSGTFAGPEGFEVAVDALAGLAFLAGGYTENVGPYTEPLRRSIRSLLRFQNDRGYFDDGESRMYGHGFATLFLAELYGMTGDQGEEVRAALKKAVNLIEVSQSSNGGWDYQPDIRFGGSPSRRESDTSITVCQAMALRAARNLGIQVRGEVVEKARSYIRKAQNPDGGFLYRLADGGSRWGSLSEFPRSAAGVCILFSLATPEEYASSEMRRGFEYLLENYRNTSRFPFYGHYYCAQAMFQGGGRYWATYFPYLRDRLIQNQRGDGSWVSTGMEITPQATAMALIALQVPFRFLPITER